MDHLPTSRTFALLISLVLMVNCSSPGVTKKSGSEPWGPGGMVVTANHYATDAARLMLEKGGHAVDAAIAAHLVLGLVEPQSSGIGGGGFMLVYERAESALTFHDGREVAPEAVSADTFMENGEVMPFIRAWQSGKAVGVPGAVALYEQAHNQHGKLKWATLFEPALNLARRGFIVSPRLASLLKLLRPVSRLDDNAGAKEYFYPNGSALQAGFTRTNPEYAQTLQRLANEGADAFYTGSVAQGIVAAVRADPDPGTITTSDLARYSAQTRPVVCGSFAVYRICGATPPSSGALQIMIAQLYERLAATDQRDSLQAFVDAQRLAYADRDFYFADPDYVHVPVEDLLDRQYLDHRAARRFEPGALPVHGNPAKVLGGLKGPTHGIDTTEEAAGTTHLSIVDIEGNAVSMTVTVEAAFGSSRWVHGFLLNNEMTDFAREIKAQEALPANAVAPRKRPRSSMSPTMVFDRQGQLVLVTGSPGGNSIPAYVAKTIVGILAWGLDAQDAVDYPNVIARGPRVRVETGVAGGTEIAAQLRSTGYDVQESQEEQSGIHLIHVTSEGLYGVADKRREGTVIALPRS